MSDSTVGVFSSRAFRESMDHSGLNRHDVAERLGVRVNMVSAMRTGKKAPSLETLTRIAEVFDRPVADFLELPAAGEWTLRHYRLAAGLTQGAVAQQLGVDATSVSRWELARTRPPEAAVTGLASLYAVTSHRLGQVIDRSHGGPAEQLLGLTDAVGTLAQIAVRAALDDPDAARRQRTLTDIRGRIIHALGIVNAVIPQLDAGTLTRAKRAVDQLARVLGDSADQ